MPKKTQPFQKMKIKKIIIMGLIIVMLVFIFFSINTKADTISTIHAVPEGGMWNNSSTWVENQIPTEKDRVEINGLVSLNSETSIDGLTISTNAILQNTSSRSYLLTINGDVINNGTIKDNGFRKYLHLNISGNIINNGEWSNFKTKLSNTQPREINGTFPIASEYVVLEDDFEIINSAVFQSNVEFSRNILTINSPNIVTFREITGSGTINGSGMLKFTGRITADIIANISEINFADGVIFTGSISGNKIIFNNGDQKFMGTIIANQIIFKGPGTKTLDCSTITSTTTINGSVTLEADAILQNIDSRNCILTINGDIINNGTIKNNGFRNYLHLNISGNIINNGEWSNFKTSLIWDNIPNVSNYEFNITDTQDSWPESITLNNNWHVITDLLDTVHYWRVRVNTNDNNSEWSEVKMINHPTNPDPVNTDPQTDPDPVNTDPQTDPDPVNTDPQTDPDPIIIVPGFMGSWYSAKQGWQLDPILHTYDNLYKALIENGNYIPNQTLFKFPYEWRQDNILSAYQLKQKINEVKSICGCDKVDIIAHSMGGLVTRYYAESDDYQNDIDQIIFLGTPHKGAPKAYLKWEGAVGFDNWKEKIIKFYFTLEGHARGYKTLFDYIQNDIKSLVQLLPDYAYIRDIDSISLRKYDKENHPDNYLYNTFLENLNSDTKINQLTNSKIDILNIIGDTGNNTVNIINVSSGQNYWPMWKHGYSEEVIKLSGDNTVPEISSSLFATKKISDTNHLSLPNKAQKQIINYLTDVMPDHNVTNTPEIKKVLLIGVFSPVDFVIIAPDGKKLGKDFVNNTNTNEIEYAFYSGFDSEIEFAVIPNPQDGKYKIELQGTEEGEYKLSTNYINEEIEINKEFIASIQTNQTQEFEFTYEADLVEPITNLEPQDQTLPTININFPKQDEEYIRNEELTIDYTVTDDFSGIASTTITLNDQVLSSSILNLFNCNLGINTLTIIAVDKAGNQAEAHINFKMITDIDSAIDNIKTIYAEDMINKEQIKDQLIKQLSGIKKCTQTCAEKQQQCDQAPEQIINAYIKKKGQIWFEQNIGEISDETTYKSSEIHNKIIIKQYQTILKQLELYYKQQWIDEKGYGVIKSNIEWLIKDTNERIIKGVW